jgi:hypothetical protein
MTKDIDERARQVLPPRFWSKVRPGKRPVVRPDLGPCWMWKASRTNSKKWPYGHIWDGLRTVSAHRWAFETGLDRPIADGLYVDHLCRRTLCVRPSHMEEVTPGENVARGEGTGARAVRTGRCGRGYEYTPENTRVFSNGHRKCRTCERETRTNRVQRQAVQKVGI